MSRNLRLVPAVREVPEDFMQAVADVAPDWIDNLSARIAQLLWQGYDDLGEDLLSRFRREEDDFVLETSITAALEPRISRRMSKYEPYYCQHECPEDETALAGSAKSPTYDIAFVWWENERGKWPIEAKVLRTDGAVNEYVRDLQEQFLTCRYAPFSSEGAMLGYLLAGSPTAAFAKIAASIKCSLDDYPDSPGRDHKTSIHQRTSTSCLRSPKQFTCHHLIMRM